MKRLLIGLVVLAALIVAADRGALWLTERVAADRAREQGLHGAVVEVRGVPFLTQLASRDLREVVVTGDAYRTELGDPGIQGAAIGPIDVTGIRVLARDVSIDSPRRFTAAQMTVGGVVRYAAVSQAAGSGTEVTAAADGQVQVRRGVTMFGRSLRVGALVSVTAAQGQVVVRPMQASVEGAGRLGAIAADAADAVIPLVTLRYPVPNLPDGLVLTEVVPNAQGLAVVLTGRAVSFTQRQ